MVMLKTLSSNPSATKHVCMYVCMYVCVCVCVCVCLSSLDIKQSINCCSLDCYTIGV
jgi:hypothetical protein